MGLFKNILKPTFKSEKDEPQPVQSKFMPEPKPPTDENFMKNFKENGGKFLYCENKDEVLSVFGEILDENAWEKSCCYDENLKSFFSKYNMDYTTNGDAPVFLSNCEYLIANIGGLLFSSNQIKEKKLHELPQNFIILATTSQLIDTIGEGLRGIKSKQQKIPTNITTIKNFGEDGGSHFLNYGSTSKNLYLLLLEDL
jgi:L-lactate utilization protein LutC